MKTRLSFLLAILMFIFAASYPVVAAEPLALPDDEVVQPRWQYTTRISVEINNNRNIETDVLVRGGSRYVVTVELRKSNGSFVTSWQKENGDVLASYDLESGERYYAKAIVKVYNSAGKVIETATENSPTITAR